MAANCIRTVLISATRVGQSFYAKNNKSSRLDTKLSIIGESWVNFSKMETQDPYAT